MKKEPFRNFPIKISYIDKKIKTKPSKNTQGRILGKTKNNEINHITKTVTIQEFLKLLSEGVVLTPYWYNITDINSRSNVAGGQYIIIDVDDLVSKDQVDRFFNILKEFDFTPNIIYHSYNHDPSKGKYKYHLIYILPKPFYGIDYKIVKALFLMFFRKVEEIDFVHVKDKNISNIKVDNSSFQPERLFYTNIRSQPRILNDWFIDWPYIFSVSMSSDTVNPFKIGSTKKIHYMLRSYNKCENHNYLIFNFYDQDLKNKNNNKELKVTLLQETYFHNLLKDLKLNNFNFDFYYLLLRDNDLKKWGEVPLTSIYSSNIEGRGRYPQNFVKLNENIKFIISEEILSKLDYFSNYFKIEEIELISNKSSKRKIERSNSKNSNCLVSNELHLGLHELTKNSFYMYGPKYLLNLDNFYISETDYLELHRNIKCIPFRKLIFNEYKDIHVNYMGWFKFFGEMIKLGFSRETIDHYITKHIYSLKGMNKYGIIFGDQFVKLTEDRYTHNILNSFEKHFDYDRNPICECDECSKNQLEEQMKEHVLNIGSRNKKDLEEVREELQNSIKGYVNNLLYSNKSEKELTLIRSDCGVGKTYSALNCISEYCLKKDFPGIIFAIREHITLREKYQEFLNICEQRYKNDKLTLLKIRSNTILLNEPEIDDIDKTPEQYKLVKTIIKKLTSLGINEQEVFEKIYHEERKKWGFEDFLTEQEKYAIKDYEERIKQSRLPNKIVFTTHARVSLGFFEGDKPCIIDENPMDTIIQDNSYSYDYLEMLKDPGIWITGKPPSDDMLNHIYNNTEYSQLYDMVKWRNDLDKEYLAIHYDYNDINFIMNFFARENKIFNDTENEKLNIISLRCYFPSKLLIMSDSDLVGLDRLFERLNYKVNKYNTDPVKPKGEIKFISKNYTKTNLSKHVNNKDDEFFYIRDIIDDEDIDYTITYSTFKNIFNNGKYEKNIYFGNCSARNELSGKNLLILGDYRVPKDSLERKLQLLYNKVPTQRTSGKKVKIRMNGKEFLFYPFFQEEEFIDFELKTICNEKRQAIGRSRINIYDDCKVVIVGQVPVEF